MNANDEQLNRLLKSAAQAPRHETAPAFALETRVMADWRASLRGEGGEALVMWFRRAAICACLMALASLALNYRQFTTREGGEQAVEDSAMGMGVDP